VVEFHEPIYRRLAFALSSCQPWIFVCFVYVLAQQVRYPRLDVAAGNQVNDALASGPQLETGGLELNG
jgi:hypothetical protein